jgi:hypothetical protein
MALIGVGHPIFSHQHPTIAFEQQRFCFGVLLLTRKAGSEQALGPESHEPPKNLNLSFKYYWEYSAQAHPLGRTVAFGLNWTYRIPKPTPPPKS